ncbi:sulfonate ABC transporter substrate-binding protein [Viridibacterium curvum]|uniref:Sulfonate ABC transporter substrate-binding protein n=1 Tax=Viridibacterium curvum TaxID=1101404 RepID=A0ABP9QNL4_9RHOO
MKLISAKRRSLFGALLSLALATPLIAHADFNPKLLRIGFQKSAATLVLLKGSGELEKRLAPQGVDVKWVEFPAGPQLLEGLNVGSIDFGFVGEAPPIVAQAAGANFVYVGFEGEAGAAEAVLVPKDSPIKSIAELKGKRVALNKGSNVHYFLVKVLEKNGLKYSDVTVNFLTPADARAAFEKGSIDAWVIWDPFTAAAEKQIGARVLANGKGVVKNYQFFLAEREFATKRADVLKVVLEEANKQGQFIAKNHKAAAAQLSPQQGLPADVLELSLSRYEHSFYPITEEALTSQQQIADTFLDVKLIPAPIKVRDALLKR